MIDNIPAEAALPIAALLTIIYLMQRRHGQRR